MRDRDLDGITYIRIVSIEREAAELEAKRFQELWEGNDQDLLPPPFRSVPIKVWAVLKGGPLTILEMQDRLGCSYSSVEQGIFQLRRRGQRIVILPGRYHDRATYQLLPGPPLKIVESPRGLTLLSLSGRVRADATVIELK